MKLSGATRIGLGAAGPSCAILSGVAKDNAIVLELAGREVRVSNPDKVFFPAPGFTKLDLVNYYVECQEAVVRHLRERPTTMKRWVNGVEGEFFFQKRVPETAPAWLNTATVALPERGDPPASSL